MSLQFPSSPSLGDTYTFGLKTWRWNGRAWDKIVDTSAGGVGANVFYSNIPPSSPGTGDFWFESDTGNFYVYLNDGDSFQWIDVGGGAGPQGLPGTPGATGATGPTLEVLGGTGITVSFSSPIYTVSDAGWQRGGEVFPETVGGIEAGTSFDNGTPLYQILESLLYPYQPVSFTAFSLGLPTTIFEVGQTGGNTTRAASWSTSGPTDNWVANSIQIAANEGIGTLVSGLDYNESPEVITYAAYNFTDETTVTFTISGEQDQGTNPSRNTYLYWRYRYFSGKTGAGFDGTNLTSQGFSSTLTRTTPNNWEVTFSAVSPPNKAYFIIPENEFSGTLTFTDTGTGLNFPVSDGGTFDHVNSYGLNVVYHIYESSNNFAGEVTVKVNT